MTHSGLRRAERPLFLAQWIFQPFPFSGYMRRKPGDCMVRRGSDRQNKGCAYVGDYRVIDSLPFSGYIPLIERKGVEDIGGKHIDTTISWEDGSKIGVSFYADKLALAYSVRNGAGRQDVADTVCLDMVAVDFGGRERSYFICPQCGRRARYLYLKGYHFECRKCAGLRYVSQRERKNGYVTMRRICRLLRDKFKVTDYMTAVGAVFCTPKRPKGMHEVTYERQLIKLLSLQLRYLRQLEDEVTRLYDGMVCQQT